MSIVRAPRRYRYVSRAGPRRRRAPYARARRYRTKSKPKIGFETVIAAGMIPFMGAEGSYASMIQNPSPENIAANLKSGFLGIGFDNKLDLWGLINPFNMDKGRYLKLLLISAGIAKVRKRMMKLPKLPLVGRYVN